MKAEQVLEKTKKNQQEFIIRYLKYEDIDDLQKAVNSLVSEKSMLGPQRKVSRDQEVKFVNSLLHKILNKKAVYLVIEYDRKVIGGGSVYAGVFINNKHVGKTGLFLHWDFRGIGLAEELLKHLIKEAKKQLKLKILKLTVYAENKKAIELYKKAGFKRVGTIKKGRYHFGRYIDLIIMVKYL